MKYLNFDKFCPSKLKFWQILMWNAKYLTIWSQNQRNWQLFTFKTKSLTNFNLQNWNFDLKTKKLTYFDPLNWNFDKLWCEMQNIWPILTLKTKIFTYFDLKTKKMTKTAKWRKKPKNWLYFYKNFFCCYTNYTGDHLLNCFVSLLRVSVCCLGGKGSLLCTDDETVDSESAVAADSCQQLLTIQGKALLTWSLMATQSSVYRQFTAIIIRIILKKIAWDCSWFIAD